MCKNEAPLISGIVEHVESENMIIVAYQIQNTIFKHYNKRLLIYDQGEEFLNITRLVFANLNITALPQGPPT